jgi:UDP-3-O-[3-hydroxymyristoyl] glucosamine N-acyltransferase
MQGFEIGHIHETAIVSEKARIGESVTIGANTIIYDNVEIGENVVIGPNSIIGEPTADYYKGTDYLNSPAVIGGNSLIRSGSVIYAGATIGERFECGHRVTIRENTIIGRHCRIGTLSDIQDNCKIGDYTRLHSNVFISQKSSIGNYVWIYPYTALTNDPYPPSAANLWLGVTVEDFVVIATKVVVLPGVRIGRNALIGATALVRLDVPPEAVMMGNPAKQVANIRNIKSKYTGELMYPWCNHFDRGMPWEGLGFHEWSNSSKHPASNKAS